MTSIYDKAFDFIEYTLNVTQRSIGEITIEDIMSNCWEPKLPVVTVKDATITPGCRNGATTWGLPFVQSEFYICFSGNINNTAVVLARYGKLAMQDEAVWRLDHPYSRSLCSRINQIPAKSVRNWLALQ